MMLTDILQTLIFALLFTVVFIAALRKRKPRFGIPALFMVLFLSIWAGGVWMSPIDGGIWIRRWPAFFFTGFFVALLLVAMEAGAPMKESTVELVDVNKKKAEKKVVSTALNVFFWILVATLIAAIIVRYLS